MTKDIKIHNRIFSINGDDNYLNDMDGIFEPQIVDIFDKLIQKEDIVFDIGANIGMTSLVFSQLADMVYSFEPSSSTFLILKENIENSNVKNVKLYNIALGENTFLSTLTYRTNNRSGGFISEKIKIKKDHITEDVEIQKLDDFIIKNKIIPSFIKIDVEGFEMSVLKGAIDTINKYNPIVFMEMNHFCLNVFHRISIQDFLDYILSLFPYVYAIDINDKIIELHDEEERYYVLHEHVTCNKYQNLVATFDETVYEKLIYKKPIKFILDEKYSTYRNTKGAIALKSGWSSPESEFTWSNDKTATIEIVLDKIVHNDLNITLEIIPFSTQNITIYINNQTPINHTIEKEQDIILSVDKNFIKENTIFIKIELPYAISPKSLGINSDNRKLAIAVKSFIMQEILENKSIDNISLNKSNLYLDI